MREYEECWSSGTFDPLHESCSGDVVLYGIPTERSSCDIEGMKEFIETCHGAFSDLEVTVDDVIAKEDRVVVRSTLSGIHGKGEFMHTEPDGTRISVSRTTVYRIENGLITEVWLCFDTLGLLEQIDAIPTNPHAYAWEELGDYSR